MKKLFFLLNLFFLTLLFGCKQTKEIQSDDQQKAEEFILSNKAFQQNNLAYQQFTPSVKFYTKQEIPGKSNEQLLNEQRAFIKISGLPDNTNYYEWAASHTMDDALVTYKTFSNENKNAEYIRTFNQYGGWLILTRLHLLSTSNLTEINNVLQKMIESEYSGFGLIDYTLNYLRENGYDKIKISGLAEKALLNAANPKNDQLSTTDINKIQVGTKQNPIPGQKDIEQLLKDHLNKKQQEQTVYLEKIKMYVIHN
jgi:uncharacterized short protein YbdD (DUF466 family)